jgi:hypothetical protein
MSLCRDWGLASELPCISGPEPLVDQRCDASTSRTPSEFSPGFRKSLNSGLRAMRENLIAAIAACDAQAAQNPAGSIPSSTPSRSV